VQNVCTTARRQESVTVNSRVARSSDGKICFCER